MTTPDHTLAARLADPNAIHINMLNGRIAKPSVTQIVHIYAGQLITTAEADARVKAAVLAEREAAKSMVWTLGHEIKASMLVDEDNERAVLDMVKATAAAIRARGEPL